MIYIYNVSFNVRVEANTESEAFDLISKFPTPVKSGYVSESLDIELVRERDRDGDESSFVP